MGFFIRNDWRGEPVKAEPSDEVPDLWQYVSKLPKGYPIPDAVEGYHVSVDGLGYNIASSDEPVPDGYVWSLTAPEVKLSRTDYVQAVQAKLDGAAQSYGYDNISNAISYAEEPAVAKFQKEGQAFRAWRSLCWAYCYDQLELVEGGEREQPAVSQLVDELPVFEVM